MASLILQWLMADELELNGWSDFLVWGWCGAGLRRRQMRRHQSPSFSDSDAVSSSDEKDEDVAIAGDAGCRLLVV